MKVCTVLVPFEDLILGVAHDVGDSFECDDSRGEYLESLGLVDAVNKPRAKRKKKEE